MKKFYTMLFAALAVCAVSCQEGPIDPQSPDTETPDVVAPEDGQTMTFTASIPTTRTTLQGNKSVWVAGDKIKITSGETTIEFTSTLKEGEMSETTTFIAPNVPHGFDGPYTAVYDMSNGANYWEQKVSLGTYDSRFTKLTAGPTKERELFFMNSTALLKFRVISPDVKEIKFEGHSLKYNDYYGVAMKTMDGEAFHTGPNDYYYMAVEPATYLSPKVLCDGVVARTGSKPMVFDASNIYNMQMDQMRRIDIYLKSPILTDANGVNQNFYKLYAKSGDSEWAAYPGRKNDKDPYADHSYYIWHFWRPLVVENVFIQFVSPNPGNEFEVWMKTKYTEFVLPINQDKFCFTIGGTIKWEEGEVVMNNELLPKE